MNEDDEGAPSLTSSFYSIDGLTPPSPSAESPPIFVTTPSLNTKESGPAATDTDVISAGAGAAESPPTIAPIIAADILSKAIAYTSTAPPEQLIVVSIGGAAVLYFVLGKLGLFFVGVIAGVVGHATLSLTSLKAEGRALHEWLEARKKAGAEEDGDVVRLKMPMKAVDFSSLPPETAKAMEELTDAVVRDYVRWWYNPILPNEDHFPKSCRNVLGNVLLSMCNRISGKRGADTFLLFLMSASNTFIVFLRELAASQPSLENYLQELPSSAMAQLLDCDLQKRKLRMAADDVLQSFFGKEILQCEPVRIFLTEILAGVVLEMTVDNCSRPDWINSWLVYLLEEETQPEVLQKIDMGEATAGEQADKAAKRVSLAEEEMNKALEEANAINKMIVEEDDRKWRSVDESTLGRSTSEWENTISSIKESIAPEEEPLEPTPPRRSVQPSTPEPLFTSFDQIPETRGDKSLHRAHISLSDLTPASTSNPYSVTPNEKALRSKPTAAEYLLQIEPASPSMPGWVVVRKYTDFETLHEVLKRIAAISGADAFRRHHADMPTWRGETLGTLRFNLEGYLNDALHERGLAGSEGMKRFLQKDVGDTAKSGFGIRKGWPNPAAFAKMGQGALDVLSKAPQGVAEGGKGLFGGMKRAFTVGQRGDDEGVQSSSNRRQSTDPFGELSLDFQARSRPASIYEDQRNGNRTSSRASSIHRFPETFSSSYIQLELPPSEEGDNVSVVSLPPPPSDIPDDYESPITGTNIFPPLAPALPPRPKKPKEPLTTQETQLIIDTVFALLSELYTLSSAWTLRRSLLNVAKSILLRPGNASLENIRAIIQETVIDANTSDAAVAALISKVRENVFPTQEERDAWIYDEMKGEELREKARRLVLAKGVPEALRGVMGAVASEEALANVFDAVQRPSVARGVVGGVVLEGVRGVCQ